MELLGSCQDEIVEKVTLYIYKKKKKTSTRTVKTGESILIYFNTSPLY